MKVLIATTSTGDTENISEGLKSLGKHCVQVFHYDQKWLQINRQNELRGTSSGTRPPLDLSAEFVNCDAELVNHVSAQNPDVVIYVSAWNGTFVPTNEALLKIKSMAPLVHFLFDGADPPWWPKLQEFEKLGLFDLTVSIDGSHDWPGGKNWKDGKTKISNAITLLTPISHQFYPEPTLKFTERPFSIGYAGNVGGFARKGVVERLQFDNMPLTMCVRDSKEYRAYAEFLQNCKIIINVPFTGSATRKHVKGRVVEAALAQACLLEWDNPQIRAWFSPRFEFEEYGSPEHCVDMCKFLMAQPKRCEEIGRALYERVRVEHSPLEFWAQVFGRVQSRSEKLRLVNDGANRS